MLVKKFFIIFLMILSLALFTQDAQATQETPVINPGEEGEGIETILIDFNQTGTQDKETYLYHNDNWLLDLNSSSDYIINKKNTYAKNVVDRGGNNRMGVRVDYPSYPNNSYALLKPPFPFIFQAGALNNDETSIGVIYNVKEIRRIAIRVAGRYFKHTLFVDLEDVNRKITSYNMGNLDFYGWRDLEWVNKDILTDVRDFIETTEIPSIYPRILPSIRLNAIKFFRNGENQGGNFIAYINSVNVTYNNVINLDALRDDIDDDNYIDDEDVWRIQAELNEELRDSYDELFENFKFRRKIFRDRVNYQGGDATPPDANNNNVPINANGAGVDDNNDATQEDANPDGN